MTGSRRLPRVLVLSVMMLLLSIAGCATPNDNNRAGGEPARSANASEAANTADTSGKPHRAQRSARRNRVGTAAAMFRRLHVRPESSAAYSRDLFGDWTSRDGCSTRQRVLIDESRRGRVTGCSVRHGTWTSPYDGAVVRTPSRLDIDHLVPLAEAYASGADRWTAGTRSRFANDLGYAGTLRAVTRSSNRAKSDGDPADWLPPRRVHRCKYIGTWIAVKYRWRLNVDRRERSVLARYVRNCGRKADVPKPRRAVVRRSHSPANRPRPHGSQRSATGGRTDRRFATCAQAKAHGLGPYRRHRDAEYSWYRDADGDGLVCER